LGKRQSNNRKIQARWKTAILMGKFRKHVFKHLKQSASNIQKADVVGIFMGSPNKPVSSQGKKKTKVKRYLDQIMY
jgi:hypothetical protein